ncbi:uncharacterized protein LOC127711133 isoform X1 [Mytilus californianus]|uniref:uncharacterized protein LOC127711133 isoform X1 n=1 Tax=Mytilus californianus TaxID=6549 RepID=UPI002246411A|nr:uncharacterized protein LOC127711133 isoform X1 [Mytilus californianus]
MATDILGQRQYYLGILILSILTDCCKSDECSDGRNCSDENTEDNESTFSSGEFAGIIAGSIVGVCLFLIFVICICNAIRRNTSTEQENYQDKPTVSSVSHISNGNTTETPRPIQENGGYINTGFIMEPTAPPYTDLSSAPPSYDDVVNGEFCK